MLSQTGTYNITYPHLPVIYFLACSNATGCPHHTFILNTQQNLEGPYTPHLTIPQTLFHGREQTDKGKRERERERRDTGQEKGEKVTERERQRQRETEK